MDITNQAGNGSLFRKSGDKEIVLIIESDCGVKTEISGGKFVIIRCILRQIYYVFFALNHTLL